MTITCDTSVLVPALLAWHPHHERIRTAMAGIKTIPAHVLIETYSVLTRLPSPNRIAPADAGEVLSALRLEVVTLSPTGHRSLVAAAATGRARGGAIYDALVAATAKEHDLTLLTRDRRARDTYDLIGVTYTLS